MHLLCRKKKKRTDYCVVVRFFVDPISTTHLSSRTTFTSGQIWSAYFALVVTVGAGGAASFCMPTNNRESSAASTKANFNLVRMIFSCAVKELKTERIT
jgi:hypothetical protein